MRRFFLFPLLLAAAPAFAQLSPEPEEEVFPPEIVSDSASFGSDDEDRIYWTLNPIKGRPPLVISLRGHPSLSTRQRLDPLWLESFFYDSGWHPAHVHAWRSKPRTGSEHLAKLAEGIAALVARAPRHGFDPNRILLVGEGYGGGLAALLATDPSWLEAAGVPFSSIRGVLALDPSGFDLSSEAAAADWRRKAIAKFVRPESDVSRFSPLGHTAAPNTPNFLLYCVKRDSEGCAESERFAAAVRSSGSRAEVREAGPSRARLYSAYLGHASNREWKRLKQFLAEVAGVSP